MVTSKVVPSLALPMAVVAWHLGFQAGMLAGSPRMAQMVSGVPGKVVDSMIFIAAPYHANIADTKKAPVPLDETGASYASHQSTQPTGWPW